jgi:hypothetical protein
MSSTPLPPPSRERSPAPMYRRQAVRIACVQFDPEVRLCPLHLTFGRCYHSMTASMSAIVEADGRR